MFYSRTVRRVSRETVVKLAWPRDCRLRPLDRTRLARIRQRVGTTAAPMGLREASGLSAWVTGRLCSVAEKSVLVDPDVV
jgi:hypothetical protein